jgi:diacylglycerol kinase
MNRKLEAYATKGVTRKLSRRSVVPKTSLPKSFACAFSGLRYALRTQRNAWIQSAAGAAVLVLAGVCNVSPAEWAVLVLTIAAVLTAEVGNTAVEALVDLVSPERHELARIAKDSAAGAVLLLAIASAAIGAIILGPPLYERLMS